MKNMNFNEMLSFIQHVEQALKNKPEQTPGIKKSLDLLMDVQLLLVDENPQN
jgi:hypothetical protein